MKIEGDKIVMDKEEFLINSLYRGVAVDLLAHLTEIDFGELHAKIYLRAEEQFEEIKKAEMIDDMLKKHLL